MRYIILSLLFALCFIGNLQAATNYYVNDANGNDSWDGLAPIWDGVHGPKRTIQLAIDVTLAGDTVIVAEGTYSDWGYLIDFGGKAITVRSNDPNDPAVVKATVIKAPGFCSSFWFHSGEDLNSVIAGFTIIGDLDTYTDYGGGILCENASSPTIYNCVIKECRAYYGGGGIACRGNSSPAVINCKIVNNRCAYASAVYCDANSNPEIINCLIDNNPGYRMILFKNSSPIITNCTITTNTYGYGDGIYCEGVSSICSPVIRNCIFANNSGTAIIESGALADPNVAFCLFNNNADGDWYDYDTSTTVTGATAINALPEASNNIDDDPLLTPNAHLQAASPCIDAGDSSISLGQLDIDYEPRIANGFVEIGADEFVDTDGDGLPDWWEVHFYNSNTAAYPGNDDDNDGKTNIVEYGLGSNPLGPYYVDVNGNDLWNGLATVWDGTNGPKATIQAAIDASQSSDTIILATGIYTDQGNRDLDFNGKALTVRSTDPNNSNVVNSTIIDCIGGDRGFYFHNDEGPDSIVSGLTITNGSDLGYTDAKGGAILCESSSPTITRCIIIDNHVMVSSMGWAEGGAIYCTDSSVVISDCTISGNSAIGLDSTGMDDPGNAQGGAISCHGGSPIIHNCIISNNRTIGGNAGPSSDEYSVRPGGVGYGGGLYFEYCNPTITDCIINNNEASGGNGGDAPDYGSSGVHGREGGNGLGGGIYFATDCSPILADCTIRKNTISSGNGGRGCRGDMGNLPGNGGNGGDALGAGVYIQDSPTIISRCKLIDNSGQAGDGGQGGDVEWPEPEPTPPPAGDGGAGGKGSGGGLYCEEKSQLADPNITITDCVINYNKVSGGLGGSGGYSMQGSGNGMDGADGETSGAGFYCNSYYEILLRNCTIVGNLTERENGRGGGLYCGGNLPYEFPVIVNCVFKNNSDHAIYDDYSGTDLWVDYSLFWENSDGDYFDADTWATYPGNILGVGDIISEPLLIADEYHLKSGSPCINSGNPGGGSSQQDIDKESRLVSGTIDIGCDEWLDSDGDGLPDWWEWNFFDSNTAAVAGDDTDVDDSNNINEYYEGTNPLGPYYVDVNGSDEWDGISASWDGTHGPKATIQAAIDIATDNDEVVVAAGTYTGLGNRDLDFYGKAITLSSTNPDDPNVVASTIIDCQGNSNNRHRGFYFHSGEDTNSVVTGFSIINGYDSYGAGIQCEDSDPLISHCIIRDMGDGSGIYCVNSSAEIRDCTISNCADYGIRGLSGSISRCVISGNGNGGIYTSATQINSCLITGNSSSNYGGGIYCTGNSTAITNCTITNNSAGLKGGGIYCYYSSPKITNCIFANNANHAIYEYQSADPFVNYCLFYNNPDGDYYDRDTSSTLTGASTINLLAEAGNNIDGDPLFTADGYHLKSFSSCINTGDPNNTSYSGQTDIDNETRIRYGRVDIGAVEVFPIAGDFEPDEDVDISDLGTFTIEWLNSCSQPDWCNNCDIDENTIVDFADFARFALYWLSGVND